MSMLATPITQAPAEERITRVRKRRARIAAAIDGQAWAAAMALELEELGPDVRIADPVVEDAIAHDMTTAITDLVVW